MTNVLDMFYKGPYSIGAQTETHIWVLNANHTVVCCFYDKVNSLYVAARNKRYDGVHHALGYRCNWE